MSTNKNAIIRYQALDRCFRRTGKKYFIEDLIEACNEALYDYNGLNKKTGLWTRHRGYVSSLVSRTYFRNYKKKF